MSEIISKHGLVPRPFSFGFYLAAKSARKAWKILCITTYRISNVIACVGVTSLKDTCAASGSSLAASDFFW